MNYLSTTKTSRNSYYARAEQLISESMAAWVKTYLSLQRCKKVIEQLLSS